MELLRGGELYSNICGRSILKEHEAYQIIHPLAECLAYLHRMGIIHRDIKPENILCNKDLFDVKIGDFGFSKLIFPNEKLDYPCGTLNYIAPEVIACKGYTTKADMWSLGVIFYLLLRGRLPFDGQTKEEIVDMVIRGTPDYTNKFFLRLSPNCREAIKGLLQKDPEMRLSAEDLLHHPWFKQMEAEEKKSQEESEWVMKEPESGGQESGPLITEETGTDNPVTLDEPREIEVQEYKESKEYLPKELGKCIPSEETKNEMNDNKDDGESKQPDVKSVDEDLEVTHHAESDVDRKADSEQVNSTKPSLQPSPDPTENEWIGVSPPPNLTPLVFPTSMQ